MDELKAGILSYVRENRERKEESKRVPTHTLYSELDRAVRDALNELYSEGRIDAGDTLNDKYIELV